MIYSTNDLLIEQWWIHKWNTAMVSGSSGHIGPMNEAYKSSKNDKNYAYKAARKRKL